MTLHLILLAACLVAVGIAYASGVRVGLAWPDRWFDDTTPTGWIDDRTPPWWAARGVIVGRRNEEN